MGINLTGQTIASTYQDLVLISGSVLSDGTGSDLTSLSVTASNAVSSSYALTASFALNGGGGTVDTGSLLLTASISDATITFTKGDATTFDITVNNVSNAISASVATSASQAANANTATSASHALNSDNAISASYALTSTSASHALDADNAVSSSYALTASFALNVTPIDTGSFVTTASISDATTTYTKADGSTFSTTVNNVQNAFTASTAVSSSYALTASYAENVTPIDTGSFMVTGSVAGNVLTFTKADTSTFALTVDTGSGGGSTVDDIWASYTGSNNLFANTASFNYTIAQGYATSSLIENSMFSAVNTQVGSARNSVIIGGTNHEMYDNTGGYAGDVVENSVILGGKSNGIFGDADSTFIVGGDNNQIEASDTNNSGIIGGANNVAYAVDNTVVVGGSSNLLRSTSDNTVAVGSTSNTLDFTSKTALINSHNNSNGDTNTNVTLISTDGATDFQDYNVYIGVNGAGRTFEAGTATTVNTYIDKLIVSSSVSASSFIGDGSGLTGVTATVDSSSFMITGSVAGNVLTFTKGDASTFALTVDTGSGGGTAFPYTGSAVITGSLAVTGSIEVLGTSALHYRLISKNGINAGSGGNIVNNTLNVGDGSIIGGENNSVGASGNRGLIFGGSLNQITGGNDGVLITGRHTLSGGDVCLVAGGFGNTLNKGYASLVGCFDINTTTGTGAPNQGLVMFGAKGGYRFEYSLTTNQPAIVIGGFANTGSAYGNGNTQIGGVNNNISGSITGSTLIGGTNNVLTHTRAAIIGGSGIVSTADDTVYVPNFVTSGSTTLNGNVTVTANHVFTLTPVDPLPSGVATGSFAVSGSTPPKPYFWDGSAWNALY